MSILLPHIAARFFGEPLMIEPGKLSAILTGLGGRLADGGIVLAGIDPVEHVAFEGGRPSTQLGVVGDPLGRAIEANGYGPRMIQRVGNVGVIPIEGSLVHKGKYLGRSSGTTSYEGLQAQIQRAARDPEIRGVVFEVDSYGGEAAGAFVTADMIAELSRIKPTLSILTESAYSAGYLLASAARRVVMPQTGGAGHIGAVMMHADLSRKLEADGISVTLVASGAHKVDGHPAMPLADDVRARMQASVDRSRDIFAGAVGRYRAGRLDKAAALRTEAMTYEGEDAVRVGLVDGIIDPHRAFAAFVQNVH